MMIASKEEILGHLRECAEHENITQVPPSPPSPHE
jgi:hypothetical protein